MENRSFDEDVFDDCWVQIFRRLPLNKRIQFEDVSPKWKRLMPYTDISSVDLGDFDWMGNRTVQQHCIWAYTRIVRDEDLRDVLMSVFSRCRPKLRHLVLRGTTTVDFFFVLNRGLADLLVEKTPDLLTLDLSSCVLSLNCLPVLARLDKLEKLRLGGGVEFTEGDFSSAIKDSRAIEMALGSTIQNLPALKKLHLDLTLNVYPPIRNASLRELEMDGKRNDPMGGDGKALTAASVQDLVRHCPNLQSLKIYFFVNRSYLQLGSLGRLPHLQSLSLSSCGILHSGDLAAICRGCPELQKLHLSPVDALTSCAELWRLSHLKHLNLWNRFVKLPVDDAVLASVARYGLLEHVCLPYAKLTADGLQSIAQCPNLVKLDISRIQSITDEGVKAVLENCQCLQELDVSGTSIGDETMAAIGANGVRLAEFWSRRTRVTEHGISRLVAERGKRLAEGVELVPLKVQVECRCPVAQKDLDAVSLKVSCSIGYLHQ